MLQYIPEIIYACRIKNDKSTTYNALKKIFPNCTKSTNSTRYGYIITKNMGKNINVHMKISDLIIFIPNLIDAIRNFIIPLNNANYFLNNIDLKNIYWDKNRRKVFFNISKMTKDTNSNKDEDKENLIKNIRDFHELRYLYLNFNTNDDYNSLINGLNQIIKELQDLTKKKIYYDSLLSEKEKETFIKNFDNENSDTNTSTYRKVYFSQLMVQ
jgi:hypothetical protein